MPEIQQEDRQEPTPQKVAVRLSATGTKARVRRKKLADKAAGVVITAGGLGIIFSIAAILVVIVAETLPLWKSPVAKRVGAASFLHMAEGDKSGLAEAEELYGLSDRTTKPLALGVDEYQSIV